MQTLFPRHHLHRRKDTGAGPFLAGILLLVIVAFIVSVAVPWM